MKMENVNSLLMLDDKNCLQEKVMTSWQIHMSFLSVTLILLEIVCIGIRLRIGFRRREMR